MNNYLQHIDYPLDKIKLIKIAETIKEKSNNYYDPRYNKSLKNWHIFHYNDEYLKKIMKDLNVNGSPRFYWLEASTNLPLHVDNNTKCSVNFILSDDPAPITFIDQEFYYTQAVINTTVWHSVTNGPVDRLLLKISIFNKSFEEVVDTIKFKKEII